jgi:DNA-binding response OmpR family regulator
MCDLFYLFVPCILCPKVDNIRMKTPEILIVEDEPSIAEVVELYLRRAGFQVQAVSAGSAALELLEKRLPDLIILDIMLPGVVGFSILRWLRGSSDTPVIFITARREEAERIAGLELGRTITWSSPSARRSWPVRQ